MPVRPKKITRKHRDKDAVPLTNEKQLKDARRETNARNKSRSKDMERRIARYLRGRRIPMSGAAAKYKGDVEIPLINHPGMYLIECKMSAKQMNDNSPAIRIIFAWFSKIHDEAKAMNAKFGILIIHFLGRAEDYVFLSDETIDKLISYDCLFADELKALSEKTPIDLRTSQKGKTNMSYTLLLKFIDQNFQSVNNIKGLKLRLPDRDYLLIRLSDFRDIVEPL